ncbi:flavin-containing monooxygenase-like protein [Xylariomycetidae sp. FL2044]|nr:flavin-containing monooxygenase-like protein [Xylariomycetidae sp. FL2044]
MAQKRDTVAVIGAGGLGLMALKNFRQDGFDAVAFETRPYLGGLWKDTDDDTISVHATTVFNTSKFRAAISDFPFPEDVDVFPTAAQFYKYLQSYADHFDLRKHVYLSHRVEGIVREKGGWTLQVRDTTTDKSTAQHFNRVCIATGTYSDPRWPKLDGIEKFQGKVLHSIDFHSAKPFEGQNVLILGMHSTGRDVAEVLSETAKHVYLSHRNGLLFLPRFTKSGMPSDVTMKLPFFLIQNWFESHLPGLWHWIIDRFMNSISEAAYPDLPAEWGIRPAPSMAVALPLLADSIYPLLKSGFAEPVPAISRILGPNSVELTNGRVLQDIDTILYCTGYHSGIAKSLIPKAPASHANGHNPMASYDPYPGGLGDYPHLYMNIFPIAPDSDVCNSLAYIGQGTLFYPGLIAFELPAMAVSQVWQGKHKLPSHAEMLSWRESNVQHREFLARKYNAPSNATFYPGFIATSVFYPWLDKTAGTGILDTFGGKFNGMFNYRTWKLWWNDRELYNLCTKGILSPLVHRVCETGGRKALARDVAVQELKRVNEQCERATRAKQQELAQSKKNV